MSRIKKWLVVGLIFALVISTTIGVKVRQTTVKAETTAYDLSNPTTSGGVTTWDCVWFGNYWQSDTDGNGTADQNDKKQPIKWRVLSVNGDDAFLLADQCLDCQKYNTECIDVTWESCTLRTWLNQDFYSAAFSSAEQSAIKTTTVVNEDNPYRETEGGNNTTDKVYLLSLSEVVNSVYGFSNDLTEYSFARHGEVTAYAKKLGVDAGDIRWWLRSPGIYSDHATIVKENGSIDNYGECVHNISDAVRPALHLDISSSQWSYASTVSADGMGSETDSLSDQEISENTGDNNQDNQNNQSSSYVTSGDGTADTGENVNSDDSINSSNTNSDADSTVTASAKVTGLKVTNKIAGKTVVSFKKVTGAAGYQLQYALNKKFTKAKKSKTTKKTSLTLKKLKKKKTYFIRVRAYKLSGKKKVYGKWSAVKKVKIKK